jgi:hypothetical protein
MQVTVGCSAGATQPFDGESVQFAGKCLVTHSHVQFRVQSAGIGSHAYDVLPPSTPEARVTHTVPPVHV